MLALVVVNLLAESPWGLFTVAATIPIAMLMGLDHAGARRRPASLLATAIGLALLGARARSAGTRSPATRRSGRRSRWADCRSRARSSPYGLAASILPMWLLLTPRDYLSTFVKLGTVLPARDRHRAGCAPS